MSSELIWMSAAELSRSYAAGTVSPVEVTAACLDQIAATNRRTNAFFHVAGDAALDQARASQERWRSGQARSAFDGIPYSLKDHIEKAGTPSVWGCAAADDQGPWTVDGSVAKNMEDAGGIFLGKTTMCELGFYLGSPSLKYGPSRNPFDLAKTAGGSSGGAAAAVASGAGPIGIGSDGGGSIRGPASYCGLVGFKPSGGRVPSWPVVTANPVQGPLTRTVADAAMAMNVLTRPDRRDYLALPADGQDYGKALVPDLANVRILRIHHMGWGTPVADDVDRAVDAATTTLEREGARLGRRDRVFERDISSEYAAAIMPLYTDRMGLVSRGQIDKLLPPTQAAYRWASQLTVDAIRLANRAWVEAMAGFMALFADYDYIVCPTLNETAFDADLLFPEGAPRSLYGGSYAYEFASFIYPVNMVALPACSIPCGFDRNGLPIGLQIIGRRYDDFGVMRIAAAYEAARGFDIPYDERTSRALAAQA